LTRGTVESVLAGSAWYRVWGFPVILSELDKICTEAENWRKQMNVNGMVPNSMMSYENIASRNRAMKIFNSLLAEAKDPESDMSEVFRKALLNHSRNTHSPDVIKQKSIEELTIMREERSLWTAQLRNLHINSCPQRMAWREGPDSTGLHNMRAYFDIPVARENVPFEAQRLHDLITGSADLSGKTDKEAFAWIERQFVEVFGEDWLMERHLPGGRQQGVPAADISWHFTRAVNHRLETDSSFVRNAINRERLFGDKSNDEIQDTIRAKFPETMTYRDLALMIGKMADVGLFDTSSQNPSWLPAGKGEVCVRGMFHWPSEHMSVGRTWEEMADEPANLARFFGEINERLSTGRHVLNPQASSFLRIIGARFDENGMIMGGRMPRDLGSFASLTFSADDIELRHSTPDLLEYFMQSLDERENHASNHYTESGYSGYIDSDTELMQNSEYA
jgi:hypothetical protein